MPLVLGTLDQRSVGQQHPMIRANLNQSRRALVRTLKQTISLALQILTTRQPKLHHCFFIRAPSSERPHLKKFSSRQSGALDLGPSPLLPPYQRRSRLSLRHLAPSLAEIVIAHDVRVHNRVDHADNEGGEADLPVRSRSGFASAEAGGRRADDPTDDKAADRVGPDALHGVTERRRRRGRAGPSQIRIRSAF